MTDPRPLVIIPAYKPSKSLPDMVKALAESEATEGVIVVDDGSGPESEPIFSKIAELGPLNGVHLLRHPGNLGKGAALKTGLLFAARNFPQSRGVVTADADGQHDLADILRVVRELSKNPHEVIMGVRSFGGEVPLRSKFGNTLTKHVLRLFSGQRISDTQTGLRGIPMDLVPSLAGLRPNGYDFELEMLLTCSAMNRPVREIPIKTIYMDGNSSSHFKPLLDSMRIYFVFIRFAGASLASALVDNGVFIAAFAACGNIFASQVIARASSLAFNYVANKKGVFRSTSQMKVTVPKYLSLAVVLMLSSYFLIRIFTSMWGWKVIISKIAAETILFFLSFVVQRCLIFSNEGEPGGEKEAMP